MVDLQFNCEDAQLSATDDTYLTEMAERIAKLRELHEEMEDTPDRWHWVKSIAEQG